MELKISPGVKFCQSAHEHSQGPWQEARRLRHRPGDGKPAQPVYPVLQAKVRRVS